MAEKNMRRLALVFFVIYALIGLLCFDDYGCGPDEGIERQTALVNYKYAAEKLHWPVSEHNRTRMGYLDDLKVYRDRYYGTALHFPLVLIEAAHGFDLEPASFYRMRHAYTFLNWYAAMVCFYFLLYRRFGSILKALLGTVMLITTPRFFAESFYNNKDILFTAWYIISTFAFIRWSEQKTLRRAAVTGVIFAFTINTRFNAIVFLPLAAAVGIYDLITSGTARRKTLISLGVLLLTTFVCFYIITPNFWESPLQTLAETLQFNSRHPNHSSEGNLFRGILVDAAETRTFIPSWMLLTIPTVYLILCGCGVIGCVINDMRSGLKGFTDRSRMTDVILFSVGFLPVLFIVATHVIIYNGWRHCYFCYPTVIYFAVWCFGSRSRLVLRRVALAAAMGAALLNIAWIIRNHPYEYDYFAPLFRSQASSFSGDYWGISSADLFRYIAASDPERMVTINHLYTMAGSINRGLLPKSQRRFFTLTYEENDSVDYYVVCRDDKPSTDIGLTGYEKVFSIVVDGDEIGTVYKRTYEKETNQFMTSE